jgi:hypothetical protein
MVADVVITATEEVRCKYTELKCSLTNLSTQVELLRKRQRDIYREIDEAIELTNAEAPTPNVRT